MIDVQIDVDASRAIKTLRNTEKKIEKVGEATARQLATIGKSYARSIAPRRTGLTIRGIKLVKNKKMEWKVEALDLHPETRARGFNLPYWMHRSSRARGHIKSGDPQFMFVTRDYLEGIAGSEARKAIKNIRL